MLPGRIYVTIKNTLSSHRWCEWSLRDGTNTFLSWHDLLIELPLVCNSLPRFYGEGESVRRL